MRHSFSTLLFLAALGLVAPVSAEEVCLCEVDTRNIPQACFYVNKLDLESIFRQYAQDSTINPLRPMTTNYDTEDPIGYYGIL